jgi:phosphohistidine phosphatase SixA
MGWLTDWLDWVLGWFNSSESKLVKAVRESTVLLCGFLPTVETVLALIAVQNPAVMTAAGIARKICEAVSPANGTMKTNLRPPMVDGVVIEGEFIGKVK